MAALEIEPLDCRPGRRASVSLRVSEQDTARALGSGDVEVLATPRVLGLAEQAAVLALGDSLPAGRTSVGAWSELEHLMPSSVGEVVTAEAVLLGVHGRRLEFTITVRNDRNDDVAHVRHRRIVVNRERFTTQSAEAATPPVPPS